VFEIQPAQPLLRLDPELGQLLAADRRATAEEQVRASVVSVGPGHWHPGRLCSAQRASNVGLLVLSGVLMREIRLLDPPSAELFGAGDIIRTWQADAAPQMLSTSIEWRALEKSSVAVMDGATALALRSYPEVMAIVLDRLHARAERLAVMQAISQITGVETRVEALLWHLSQRWGRVGKDGVIVGLALSHRMIGSLVGARRPTVSTALARLMEEGRVVRRADGAWLLTATEPPITQPEPAHASASLAA
jgi:CRP/FNR family cyclic AMP-dependent transcriptional regulator